MKSSGKYFQWQHQRGYTLMELIVVILMLGIVGSMTLRLMSATMETYEMVMMRSQIVNDGRLFASRFYREVKPLPFSDSLLVAGNKSLQWKTQSGRIYTYTITGSQVNRQVNSGLDQMLVSHVDYNNSAFTYYDSTNTELSSVPLNSSDRMRVRLIGATMRFSSGSETFTSQQRIYLANLRRN
ncbi:MAG TPA: hypothetical protein DHU63_11050 [Candidatus Marinimicrobia bacterium]|nr:MAG: hypothetical protein AUJ47_07705 [Candidatus Marinimicrobia bacterium CG1_02_48_14]PIZ70502.1 MAG: hypothetical protein COY19_00035 [Candidatus Marinimicrobia bacterium CG_4_10_14_0_2_um_filter_48_9]PJA51959.1 MAG: hypothetical protein CO167_11150 [Candidatus Marinimicrobia bacterium CG_4_9_14_3_um_filter_48_9]HCW77058.1 hypothetical protein [Candidatus Neomarinimicrobiota bacterium]